MAFGKFKKAAKKAAKKAGRAANAPGKATGRAVRAGARRVGEATPGYGSYAKTIKKLVREGKTGKNG